MIENELARAIRNTIRKGIPVMVTEGTVEAVDKETRTCHVKRDGLPDLIDVRLNAILSPTGDTFTIYPQKGSNVLCVLVDNQPADAFIISVTNYDEIVFGDGSLGGFVKAKELKTQVDKNTDILKALMNILNGAPITEPGNESPSAFQTALKGALAGKQTADLSNIENPKIKH